MRTWRTSTGAKPLTTSEDLSSVPSMTNMVSGQRGCPVLLLLTTLVGSIGELTLGDPAARTVNGPAGPVPWATTVEKAFQSGPALLTIDQPEKMLAPTS